MYKTDHKRLLIDIFENNKAKSYSAVKLICDLDNVMNKATIYRQLKSLEEEKIIRKVYNNDLKMYEYQYADDCHNHFHLKCVKCGKITHLKCSEANSFVNHIYEAHGFSINQYSSDINGICKDCK